jgi:hypothetical protein
MEELTGTGLGNLRLEIRNDCSKNRVDSQTYILIPEKPYIRARISRPKWYGSDKVSNNKGSNHRHDRADGGGGKSDSLWCCILGDRNLVCRFPIGIHALPRSIETLQ